MIIVQVRDWQVKDISTSVPVDLQGTQGQLQLLHGQHTFVVVVVIQGVRALADAGWPSLLVCTLWHIRLCAARLGCDWRSLARSLSLSLSLTLSLSL